MTTTAIPSGRMVAISGLWLCFALGLLTAMASYGTEQGVQGEAPRHWPQHATSLAGHQPGLATLVLFAHPLCPCTRASLWELESITNRFSTQVQTHVLFFSPSEAAAAPTDGDSLWHDADLHRIAARLPATQIHADVDGRLSASFGAYTSGQVLFYDEHGALQYAGGITPSRGHTGSNPGRATIVSAMSEVAERQRQPAGDTTFPPDPTRLVQGPVFGCSIHDDNDRIPVTTEYPPAENRNAI